jgi:predicted aldo/keto reductase-like oxidoreductase
MEMVTLGKTGCSVSRIGFGGAPAGLKNYLHAYDPSNADDRGPVLEAIGKALELGINYFDVAPGYGDGAAEAIFGEALADTPSERVFLATKVGVWKDEPVRASLEASLRRLRRPQVDLLQIHGTVYNDDHVERVLRPGGMLDQMEALRDEGLVRHIGFTCEAENEALYRFIKTGRFEVIQMCYNLLFQHPYDVGWKSGSLYEAEKQGMGITVMRSTTSSVFQRWVQAVNPANTFDYTPALIQFQLSNPIVDVALVGMRSAKRVIDNVRIAENLAGRVDLTRLFARYV